MSYAISKYRCLWNYRLVVVYTMFQNVFSTLALLATEQNFTFQHLTQYPCIGKVKLGDQTLIYGGIFHFKEERNW